MTINDLRLYIRDCVIKYALHPDQGPTKIGVVDAQSGKVYKDLLFVYSEKNDMYGLIFSKDEHKETIISE